ncbi:MAG: H(+)-transporting ATPase [Pedosphaera sp.]|nr:H(+)-transporting ATPase [Pedosphaera sp.]
MKIGKQARRDAKDLFLACRREGILDSNRVRQTVTQVLEAKPRNYLGLLSHFQRLVQIEIETHTVRIENSVPTSDALMAELQASLTRRYGLGLEFEFHVDPSLIGGLRIQIGSDVYDGTVKSRLTALESSF